MLGAGLFATLMALGGGPEAGPAGYPEGAVNSVPAVTGGGPGAPSLGLVVVLRPVAPDDLTEAAFTRVAGELSAARFRVLILPLEPRADPAREVETVSADQEPIAALAMARVHAPLGDSVAIWTCDRRSRRTTILRIQTTLTQPDRQAAVLAVEAIELIRAHISGLETALSPPASPPDAPSTATIVDPRFADSWAGSRLRLGSGAGATWDVGLGGPSWSALLWGGFRVTPRLTIGARISALGTPLRITAPSGTADVHRDVAQVGLSWTFADTGLVDGFLSLGAAIAQVRAVGAAPSPAQAHAVTDWPFLASAGIGTRLKISQVVAVVASAEMVVAPRRLNLRFLDDESVPFSRPGAFVHAGLETAF